ncbi:ParA family protein [Paludisphaera mucosa]|uniref:ParA family protein n=1 Tax=Paludisphaera mucosa TaxID=3030827 RepID=A0ABT6FM63_9BACT|nr:ParA family protein [Paludisphaera mucosa]MDG3008470.1 ParA family protein [Paludisphaera mucosa]
MIITVASFKGGVAKTTTAIHLAALVNEDKPTLLIDGDPNRSASGWSRRGSLPFKIADERLAARLASDYRDGHLVFDTKARPEKDDLVALAEGCDLLIIPTTPDAMALEALTLMMDMLSQIKVEHRVLITKVPPPPRTVGQQVREALVESGYPVFKTHMRLYAAYEKAAEKGILVNSVKDRNAKEGWSDCLALAKEVLR